ncbi:MAG: nucleotide exchange factor GrpE [Candidatus Babeliales bacterium]
MNENENKNDQAINEQEETMQSEQTKSDSYREQYLRLNADLQNFKKRVEKERSEWMQLAQISILKAFLPTVDDLERAINTAQTLQTSFDPQQEGSNAWLEGFVLIQKNLAKQLADLGVTEIDCSGAFNPELHEALIQIDNPDVASGSITAVLNKGYVYQDKVIRHAQVSVAK